MQRLEAQTAASRALEAASWGRSPPKENARDPPSLQRPLFSHVPTTSTSVRVFMHRIHSCEHVPPPVETNSQANAAHLSDDPAGDHSLKSLELQQRGALGY
jgi:hypothetical protein